MNNVVLMFSATDEKTPYEQGELVTARSIVHKFLNFPGMDQAWKSIKTLLLASISWKDLILHGN